MAFDKVVDSAKLDAGMKATADAIRAKTGATDEIPWEESTGFAEAVEVIQVGAGEGSATEYLVLTEVYAPANATIGYNPATLNWELDSLDFSIGTWYVSIDGEYYEGIDNGDGGLVSVETGLFNINSMFGEGSATFDVSVIGTGTHSIGLYKLADSIGGSDPVIEPLEITENGTYEAPDGVDGYSPVTVNVAASGGDDGSFKTVIEKTPGHIKWPDSVTVIGERAFHNHLHITVDPIPDTVTRISDYAFYSGYGDHELVIDKLPAQLTYIGIAAFRSRMGANITEIPAGVTEIGSQAFYSSAGDEITFKGTPTTIHSKAFDMNSNLATINVPWAEGEVANAPWGATNATINYNYTGG